MSKKITETDGARKLVEKIRSIIVTKDDGPYEELNSSDISSMWSEAGMSKTQILQARIDIDPELSLASINRFNKNGIDSWNSYIYERVYYHATMIDPFVSVYNSIYGVIQPSTIYEGTSISASFDVNWSDQTLGCVEVNRQGWIMPTEADPFSQQVPSWTDYHFNDRKYPDCVEFKVGNCLSIEADDNGQLFLGINRPYKYSIYFKFSKDDPEDITSESVFHDVELKMRGNDGGYEQIPGSELASIITLTKLDLTPDNEGFANSNPTILSIECNDNKTIEITTGDKFNISPETVSVDMYNEVGDTLGYRQFWQSGTIKIRMVDILEYAAINFQFGWLYPHLVVEHNSARIDYEGEGILISAE